jgi:flavin-dependent dehydrogenase
MSPQYDVAIVGGGPGGSTLGAMLLKYQPRLKVVIIEREEFPREHVGESQLPQISGILHEIGVWDQVERAGFPVKIGATYKWGKGDELWDFNFVPPEAYEGQARPGKYAGIRQATAFQVDRSLYDTILLRHAEQLGCTVWESTAVREVVHAQDTIQHLQLSNGEAVTARYYVDASGHVGILRRNLGVQIDCPTSLKNIAIWDYWNNTAWADTIGSGGTRVQVMSVGFGWLWFIPITPTRTSLGLVCPASYYKESKLQPEELYQRAIAQSERITGLLNGATREKQLRTTNDWSFVSERVYGKNWFLVGEAAGFADPILAAGLTLTHVGARELAYTILALDEKQHDGEWLKSHYQMNQQKRVRQHMRFAEFW